MQETQRAIVHKQPGRPCTADPAVRRGPPGPRAGYSHGLSFLPGRQVGGANSISGFRVCALGVWRQQWSRCANTVLSCQHAGGQD